MAVLTFLSKYSRTTITTACLIIIYIVGLVGMLGNLHPDFILLTPINLLVCLGMVLMVHPRKEPRLALLLTICYLVGFAVEIIGVQTGVLFGSYEYGATLGPKIFGTPFMIGVNWAMLVYLVTAIMGRWIPNAPNVLKATIGATMMVSLDVLIEPVAVSYDFWAWNEAGMGSFLVAPLQNYIVWWIVAFPLVYLANYWMKPFKNLAADTLFLLQIIFFIALYFNA